MAIVQRLPERVDRTLGIERKPRLAPKPRRNVAPKSENVTMDGTASKDAEKDRDPGWVTGSNVEFVARSSPRVAEYRIPPSHQPYSLRIRPSGPNTRIILNHEVGRQQMLLNADGAPGGTKIDLVVRRTAGGNSRQQLSVKTEGRLKQVSIVSDEVRIQSLMYSFNRTTTLALRLPLTRLDLSGPAAQSERINLKIGSDGTLGIHAHSTPACLWNLDSSNTSAITINTPIAAGSHVETSGPLNVQSQVGTGSLLKASDVAVRRNLAGSPDQPISIESGKVTLGGNGSDLRVVGDELDVAGTLWNSEITAKYSVRIAQAVTNCTVRVSETTETRLAVLVGQEPEAHSIQSAVQATFAKGCEGEVPSSLPGSSSRPNMSGSTLTTLGPGLVVLGPTTTSSLDVEGDALVSTLDAGSGNTIRIGSILLTKKLTCADASFDAQNVGVTGTTEIGPDAAVHGRLWVGGGLKGSLTTAPASDSPASDVPTLRLAYTRVDGPLENVVMHLSEGMKWTDSGNSLVDASGPVTFFCNSKTLHTDGNLDLALGIEDANLKVGADAKVLIRDSTTLDAEVAGSLELLIPTTDPATEIQFEKRSVVVSGGAKSPFNVDLEEGACLTLKDTTGQRLQLELLDRERRETQLAGAGRSTMTPNPSEQVLDCRTSGSFHKISIKAALGSSADAGNSIIITGKVSARIAGAIAFLWCCPDESGEYPQLSFPTEDTVISGAVGDFGLLGPFSGRVHGPQNGEWQIGKRTNRPALRLRKLDTDQLQPPSGSLIDIDPTSLPYGDLETLTDIHVIDATPHSLRDKVKHAARTDVDTTTKRARLREDAEWMTKYVNVTRTRAGSGTSRVAGQWAANKLHHLSLPSGREKVLRYAHRAVGYSNKIWPPLVTWAVAVILISLLSWFGFFSGETPEQARHNVADANVEQTIRSQSDAVPVHLKDSESPEVEVLAAPKKLGEALGDGFSMPLSIFRLGSDSVVFNNRLVSTLATLFTAVPLFYLILALRNFLREPGEK